MPLFRDYTCLCLSNNYVGRYCETKQSPLLLLQKVTKSFASIATVYIVCICLFVIVLDILRFVFGINSTLADLKRLLRRRAARKTKMKKKKLGKAVHFTYVN